VREWDKSKRLAFDKEFFLFLFFLKRNYLRESQFGARMGHKQRTREISLNIIILPNYLANSIYMSRNSLKTSFYHNLDCFFL